MTSPTYPIWDSRFKWSSKGNVLQRFRDAGFEPPEERDRKEREEAAVRAVRNFEREVR